MSTVGKQFLSGSTNGRAIKVVATATPGTTIHTADATAKDEIWLYACNTDTQERVLTIEFGGTTSPDDDISITLSPNEPLNVIPGVCLGNSLVVKAFAATANKIIVYGFVNRLS